MLNLAVCNPEPRYSFEELALPLYNELICFARKLALNDVERAADIVQDSLVKALRAWPRFECEEGLDLAKQVRGWLYIIVNNTFMKDYHRAKVRHRAAAERQREIILGTYGNDGLEDLRDKVDSPFGDEVRLALSFLSNDHRAVIEAFYVRGLGCDAIAVELGIPKNTVFTRLDRARKALVLNLAGYANNLGFGLGGEDLAEPTETVQTDSESVDGVVAFDDSEPLEDGESAVQDATAW